MKPVKASEKSVFGQNVFALPVVASSTATLLSPMKNSNNSESVFEILCKNHERFHGKDKEDSSTEFTDVDDLYAQLKETIALVKDLKLENNELKETIVLVKELELENSDLKAKCDEKDEKLAEINDLKLENSKLKAECDEKDEKLAEKDEKLAESKELIQKLQREVQEQLGRLKLNNAEETKKETQLDVTELLRFALDTEYKNRKLVNTLEDCGFKACQEGKYNEALQHYQNAIEIELSKLNNADKLADLYLWTAHVYFYFKQYSFAISDLYSAFEYRCDCLFSSKLLAKAEIESGEYSWAKIHLEEILLTDRYDAEARHLLDVIQEKMYGTGNGKLFDDEVAVEHDFDQSDGYDSYSDSSDDDSYLGYDEEFNIYNY